jgi:hypothetical protein
MDNLIDKSKKLTALLEELNVVTEAEKHKYIVKLEYKLGDEYVYSIYDNTKQEVIKMDKLDRIKSYFNVRNINEADVYYLLK